MAYISLTDKLYDCHEHSILLSSFENRECTRPGEEADVMIHLGRKVYFCSELVQWTAKLVLQNIFWFFCLKNKDCFQLLFDKEFCFAQSKEKHFNKGKKLKTLNGRSFLLFPE